MRHIRQSEHTEMVLQRQRHAGLIRPGSGGWWVCLLAAVLFVYHSNYLRIHLLTEVHHGDARAEAAQSTAYHQGTDEHGHEDHHQPHSASDHQLQTPLRQQAPCASLAFLPAATSFDLTGPEKEVIGPFFERHRIPGASPPNPFQPRAPPLV